MAKYGGMAGGVYSVPSWYSSQKNLRLLAERTAREKEALGPNWQMIATVTPMGAGAFGGGRIRSEENFDMMVQAFANGATGFGIFTDGYVDDPGIYLAWGEAISLTVPYEDIIFNGSIARDLVKVAADNAQASAIHHRSTNRAFIAISPDAIMQHGGTDRPPMTTVDLRFDAGTTGLSTVDMQLTNLRDGKAAPVKCLGGKCKLTLHLDSTAVLLFAPAK